MKTEQKIDALKCLSDIAKQVMAEDPPKSGRKDSGLDGSYYDLRVPIKDQNFIPRTEGEVTALIECNDVIDALGMDFNMGELFKSVWRYGRKPGETERRSLEKIFYFAKRLLDADLAKSPEEACTVPCEGIPSGFSCKEVQVSDLQCKESPDGYRQGDQALTPAGRCIIVDWEIKRGDPCYVRYTLNHHGDGERFYFNSSEITPA